MAIVGIDLGTINSAVAVYRNGEAEIIPNVQHERTTPSVFQVKPNGEEIIGRQAKMNAASYPDRTVLEVIRLMGRTRKSISVTPVIVQKRFLPKSSDFPKIFSIGSTCSKTNVR